MVRAIYSTWPPVKTINTSKNYDLRKEGGNIDVFSSSHLVTNLGVSKPWRMYESKTHTDNPSTWDDWFIKEILTPLEYNNEDLFT